MFFAGDDRFSAANSLRREYDSLLEQKQFLVKENQDLREFERQMQQKLTSHHEVLRMLSTNIQSAKLEIKRLKGIKEELLNRKLMATETKQEHLDILPNNNNAKLDTKHENSEKSITLENILSTSYSEEVLSSLDSKDILHIIQTLKKAVQEK